MSQLGPGPHTRVRRLPEKATYDEETAFAIIDEALMCHVAALVDGLAMTLPTLHVRLDSTIYVHGSQSNALLRAARDAGTASLSFVIYDGLRLARSGFESSVSYRSVVVVGATREVNDADEKRRALDAIVEAALPGRSREVREMTEREVNLTLVLAVEIEEAAAKISAGPTSDGPEDAALPIWSGTVPARVTYGEPVPSADGAMARGDIVLPPSLRQLLGRL